ncbi:hypothetical protein K7432_006297 [Basidiobolus ranarum]|uniref:Uncharacterized protein n=1 Tax=Basidiobolus ranarum TaxID=34480 RepID=A0ABR2WV50_9FUNG
MSQLAEAPWSVFVRRDVWRNNYNAISTELFLLGSSKVYQSNEGGVAAFTLRVLRGITLLYLHKMYYVFWRIVGRFLNYGLE